MGNCLLSIVCNFYNHAKFASEAIESFLMQKINFEYELLLLDDFSKDGTDDIIRRYEKKFPDKIKAIYNKENQGSKGVNNWTKYQFPRAKGKYIALCDGDDYWTDPYKLQKQVDLLEQDENYNLCYTDGTTFYENLNKEIDNKLSFKSKKEIDIYDIAKGENNFYIYTSNVVFRNISLNIPESFIDKVGFDTSLFLLLLENDKKGVFLNEKTAVYRVHENGIFSSRDNKTFEKRGEVELGIYEMIDAWEKYFSYDKRLVKYFRKSKLSTLNKLRVISCENKNIITTKKTSLKILRYLIFNFDMKLLISSIISLLFTNHYFKYLENR